MYKNLCLFLWCLFPLFCKAQGNIKVDTTVLLNCDGRFTLGTKNFKLMYGYPYPYSTSHFLLNVNNKIATNRPYLANTTHLKGRQKTWKMFKASYTTVSYEFEDVLVVQKLVPVDKELQELNGKNYTQYYRVEYDVINKGKGEKQVGLIMFFDTQIAENDNCIMQTCKYENIRKGKNFLEKVLSLFSFASQTRERRYVGDDVPEVVLVFKSEERHKDITGAFILDAHQATPPDEALIGRWTFYRNVRWAYGDPNKANVDYTDSALLLRWRERALAVQEKRRYATYYGVLDLDTVGVTMTLPPEKNTTKFEIVPDTIYQGESAELVWETRNPIKADVFITGIRNKQANKGRYKVSPLKNEDYMLRLVLSGKEVEFQERTLVVLPKGAKKGGNAGNVVENKPDKKPNEVKNLPTKSENKKIAQSEKKFDGRFTIGTEGKNILFGYPYNYSTSHFILQVGNKIVTNDDKLGGGSVYVAGKLTTKNEKGSPKTVVEYEFEGLRITQKLTPVDINLSEIQTGFGQYYLIEYQFTNNGTQNKEIGFALMLDAMVGNDDNAQVKQNASRIPLNTRLVGEDVPSNLFLVSGDNNGGLAELILAREKATKPDEVLVSIWQHLDMEGYLPKTLQKLYTNDCALHLRWNKQTLRAQENKKIGVYVGNTTHRVVALHHQQKASAQYDVYFDLNEYALTAESLETLAKVLERTDYAYIVVEGFTDQTGSVEGNYTLSQKRVRAVQEYLTQKGIDARRILIKSHGQHFAGKESDEKERRVSVIAFD